MLARSGKLLPVEGFATRLSRIRGTICRNWAPSAPEKHAIGRICRLFDAWVAQTTKKFMECRLIGRRNLHSNQNSPIIGAVVAVMEQTYVPSATHAVQKLHKRPGTFRKLEAVQDFVFRRRRVASDQMPDVNLGHLVVRQVVGLNPALVHRAKQFRGFVPVAHFDTHEQVCDLGVSVPIIELGDIALAEERAELAEAARPLRDRHRENRLALLPQLGLLRNESQAGEIHVRTTSDRNPGPVAEAGALAPELQAGDRQCSCGLENRSRVLEYVLERRANGVGIDQHDVIDQLAANAKCLPAYLSYRHAVGKQSDMSELDAASRGD